MSAIGTMTGLMKADILERTRRYSFLVTIAATLYLGYLINDGTISVHLGKCRPVPNSAWTGMMMALCTITFVGLVGFYIVKNAIERDRETGVGQILAGTPVKTWIYILAKVLSNFAVLGIITAVLAAGAVLMQVFKGEGLDIPALLSPFLFLALPAMFFTGAIAVFFESVRLLRGGFGNILYFFVFSALIVVPMLTGLISADVFGIKLAMDRIQADIRAAVPEYDGNFSIGSGARQYPDVTVITWNGISWDAGSIGSRSLPVAYALVLSLIAAGLFDRFAAAAPARRGRRTWNLFGRIGGSRLERVPELILAPFSTLMERFVFGRMLLSELRLMLQGLPWWWYAVALSLWAVSAGMETPSSRANLLPFLWIWPALLWSGMGTRERRFRTGGILFSAPRPLARQFPAAWCAGCVVALLFASGVLVRTLLGGETGAALAILGGALFIPSLAIALGVWSGTSKTFEAIYVALWYVGPAHHTAGIDFMGTTDAALGAGAPAAFAAGGLLLFAAALLGRRRQLSAA